MKRLLGALTVTLAAVGGLFLAGGQASASATAAAAPTGSGVVITAFSAPGDWIGGGKSAEFDGTNAKIKGTATAYAIKLAVNTRTPDPWNFLLAPPRGSTFRVGYFPGTQYASTRAKGHPGLLIAGPGTGCSLTPGSIDVRDIAYSGTKITRLDLLYTQYCDASAGALFGEIRINEPQPAGLLVSASSITWPATGAGGPIPAPVVIRNRGSKPVKVSAATLTGFSASQFQVSGSGCVGRTLAPGASCSVLVSLRTAPAAGPRTADLRLKLGAETDQIQLDAPVPPGTTSLVMQSQPGDWVGSGDDWNFDTANAGFLWDASTSGVTESVKLDNQFFFAAAVHAATGHTLKPGTYTDAAISGSGNDLSVSGDGHGCNTITGAFTVKQAVFSGSTLEHFDATFTQHCDGAAPALTGEMKYDSAPVVAAPPRVSDLKAKRSGGKLTLSWKNPAYKGYRYTMIRVQPGRAAGVGPSAGTAAYAGNGHQTTVSALPASGPDTIVAYTVDQYGNVSAPVELTLAG